jgi:hypothetical protein
MKRKLSLIAALAALAALTVVSISPAAVTFDQEAGTGFVGKGDVQLVFNWNNKQLQDNSSSVEFRYAEGESVSWTCVDANGAAPPNPASQTRASTQSVAGAPNADPRQKKGQQQFTGFDLTGYDGDPVVTEEGDHTYPECTVNRAHDPELDVIESLGSGLEVSVGGTNWHPIG